MSNQDEAFKNATLSQCEDAFKKFYATDFNAADVKVINSNEVTDWISKSPWKDKTLPCEIQDVLTRDKGNTNPSPVALDVSGSAPEKGVSMIYFPITSKVSCESPKSGFFLDDAAKSDCQQVMVCNGEVGGNCTCTCVFPCTGTETLCKQCAH